MKPITYLPPLLRPLPSCLFVALLLVVQLTGFSTDARARAALPTCEGKNLVNELKEKNKSVYEELIKKADIELNTDGVFWKIQKEGEEPSYLLGTVHTTDPRITKLPEASMKALTTARSVAVEIAKLDPADVQLVVRNEPELFFTLSGVKLNTVLSSQDYNILLAEARKNGIRETLVPVLKPWFASISFFAVPPCERKRMGGQLDVLDKLIVKWGREAGATIHSLETLTEQYQAFASIPYDDQITLLENGIHTHGMLGDIYATTLDAYIERQLGMIMPLSLAFARDKAKSVSANASFRSLLIYARNEIMFQRALPLVKKGNVFIAVGALHLTGEKGLVEMFRKSGYQVSKVY